jgi:hypothetical protein
MRTHAGTSDRPAAYGDHLRLFICRGDIIVGAESDGVPRQIIQKPDEIAVQDLPIAGPPFDHRRRLRASQAFTRSFAF